MRRKVLILIFALSSISLCKSYILQDNSRTKREIDNVISENDKQAVLAQFDRINQHLIEWEEILAQNISSISYSPTLTSQPRTMYQSTDRCTLSKLKLEQLHQEINDALTEHDQSNGINCDVNENNPAGTCNELIKVIQCSLSELKSAFLKAVNNNDELTRLEKKYNLALENYKRFMDDNLRDFSQKSAEKINQLIDDMQELQMKIKRLQDSLENEFIDNISNRIEAERLSDALEKFERSLDSGLDYTYIIESVVENVYAYKKIENILTFLSKLPAATFMSVGYKKLFTMMKQCDSLMMPKIIMLHEYAWRSLVSSPGNENFLSDVNSQKRNFIKLWSINVRQNNCGKIYEFLKQYYSYTGFILDLVDNAFVDRSNTGDILNCITGMPSYEIMSFMLWQLYNSMRSKQQLNTVEVFRLAKIVKTLMERSDFNKDIEYLSAQKLKDLKENLPRSVREITWSGSDCTIKNIKRNEYLYAAINEYDYNADRRRVFTWIPGNYDQQCLWQFNSRDSSKFFEIRSKYYNEYIYAPENDLAFDVDRRNIFTWKQGGSANNEDLWILEPNESASAFRIKSKRYNECLYAAQYVYDKDRRSVFTWRTQNDFDNDDSNWDIRCS